MMRQQIVFEREIEIERERERENKRAREQEKDPQKSEKEARDSLSEANEARYGKKRVVIEAQRLVIVSIKSLFSF